MKKLILFILIITMGMVSFGKDDPRISVSGQGTVEVAPDTSVISFAVVTQGKDVTGIKSENDRISKRAIEALLKEGISRKDLFTTGYTISQQYNHPKKANEERERVNVVRNQMRVSLKDINKTGEIISILEKSGVNNIQGVTFTTSKADELKLQALKLAYEDAKEKAEYLASLEGYKVEVADISTTGYTPRPERYMAADTMMAKNGTPVLHPTEVSVSVNLTAEFNMVK